MDEDDFVNPPREDESDHPKPKKKRRRLVLETPLTADVSEALQQIDEQALEEKSRRYNMTPQNIKSLLNSVLKTPEVRQMMFGLAANATDHNAEATTAGSLQPDPSTIIQNYVSMSLGDPNYAKSKTRSQRKRLQGETGQPSSMPSTPGLSNADVSVDDLNHPAKLPRLISTTPNAPPENKQSNSSLIYQNGESASESENESETGSGGADEATASGKRTTTHIDGEDDPFESDDSSSSSSSSSSNDSSGSSNSSSSGSSDSDSDSEVDSDDDAGVEDRPNRHLAAGDPLSIDSEVSEDDDDDDEDEEVEEEEEESEADEEDGSSDIDLRAILDADHDLGSQDDEAEDADYIAPSVQSSIGLVGDHDSMALVSPTCSTTALGIASAEVSDAADSKNTALTSEKRVHFLPEEEETEEIVSGLVKNRQQSTEQLIARRTRSKLSLADATLDELEAMLCEPPVDHRPDLSQESSVYENFLTMLRAEDFDADENEEEHSDTEYNFLGDFSNHLHEPDEEYRDDKAVRVTPREVVGLIESLDDQSELAAAAAKRMSPKKKRHRGVSLQTAKVMQQKQHPPPAATHQWSEQQLCQLQMQLHQHGQLLAQTVILTQDRSDWNHLAGPAKTMLTNLVETVKQLPVSIATDLVADVAAPLQMLVNNLPLSADERVSGVEGRTDVVRNNIVNVNHMKVYLQHDRRLIKGDPSKIGYSMSAREAAATNLLPDLTLRALYAPLERSVILSYSQHRPFLKSEDLLLLYGTMKENHLSVPARALLFREKLLPNKETVQIQHRIKNLAVTKSDRVAHHPYFLWKIGEPWATVQQAIFDQATPSYNTDPVIWAAFLKGVTLFPKAEHPYFGLASNPTVAPRVVAPPMPPAPAPAPTFAPVVAIAPNSILPPRPVSLVPAVFGSPHIAAAAAMLPLISPQLLASFATFLPKLVSSSVPLTPSTSGKSTILPNPYATIDIKPFAPQIPVTAAPTPTTPTIQAKPANESRKSPVTMKPQRGKASASKQAVDATGRTIASTPSSRSLSIPNDTVTAASGFVVAPAQASSDEVVKPPVISATSTTADTEKLRTRRATRNIRLEDDEDDGDFDDDDEYNPRPVKKLSDAAARSSPAVVRENTVRAFAKPRPLQPKTNISTFALPSKSIDHEQMNGTSESNRSTSSRTRTTTDQTSSPKPSAPLPSLFTTTTQRQHIPVPFIIGQYEEWVVPDDEDSADDIIVDEDAPEVQFEHIYFLDSSDDEDHHQRPALPLSDSTTFLPLSQVGDFEAAELANGSLHQDELHGSEDVHEEFDFELEDLNGLDDRDQQVDCAEEEMYETAREHAESALCGMEKPISTHEPVARPEIREETVEIDEPIAQSFVWTRQMDMAIFQAGSNLYSDMAFQALLNAPPYSETSLDKLKARFRWLHERLNEIKAKGTSNT